MTDYKVDLTNCEDPGHLLLNRTPEFSDWTCYLFGNRPGGMGITYTPQKGQVPNRFVRFMMRICFDCYWVKKEENN